MTTATPRPTFCLLGLPFDPLSLPEAEQVLRNGVAAGEAGILSTPNLNWIALARQNPAFRQSVLISDCCVADGMPLVWLARLLGLPFPERVSGADLIERLRKGRPSLRVFFFGGLGDVAERAVSALRRSPGGLVAVGSLNPGQGTVESMSSESMIAAINACRPDIVIVYLQHFVHGVCGVSAEELDAWIVLKRGDFAVLAKQAREPPHEYLHSRGRQNVVHHQGAVSLHLQELSCVLNRVVIIS